MRYHGMKLDPVLPEIEGPCPSCGRPDIGQGFCPVHHVQHNGIRRWCPVAELRYMAIIRAYRKHARAKPSKWWSATLFRQWLLERERARLRLTARYLEELLES